MQRKILRMIADLGIESVPHEIVDVLPLAIIRRPNVGKSTLLNAIVGEQVSKVSEIPGTTLDYVTSNFSYRGKQYRLYDTAGIRKKGKTVGLERIAYEKTLAMVKYIQPMVVLLIDATEEMAQRDKTLLGELHDLHIPLLVAINKIDQLEPHETERYIKQLRLRYKIFEHVPLIGIS
ncbi:MAG: 50S ribosome-binding GTPase [Candidatus Peribacteria bacterium]|nr:MAG: 50S ribosome-binding GTPase [Candidatus Peribacteria bacterium]